MPAYSLPLIRREEIAEGTMAFYFDLRGTKFTFKPGQSVDITLENLRETDAGGNVHTFSIANEPEAPELMIVTRMRDTAFKRGLKTLPLGSLVSVRGPSGRFTLPTEVNPSPRPVVFLAGGIGITPFLSMIRHATQTKSPQKIVLFCSNRRPEDTAFLHELQTHAKQNPHFTFVPTMTQMEKSAQEWGGERGHITPEMLAMHVSDLNGPTFMIAGPPAMVETIAAMLRHEKVDEARIRAENFSGY